MAKALVLNIGKCNVARATRTKLKLKLQKQKLPKLKLQLPKLKARHVWGIARFLLGALYPN
jgi:hypothetical protein